MKPRTIRSVVTLALVIFFTMGTSSCLFFGGKAKEPLAGTKAAPDAVLYHQAVSEIKHGQYTMARLALQTLINTYPNSEYLAKAKLAIANSYYKEGGTEGLTQAVAEYKDFITFFPFLHEAAFAQYRAAMGHFRMMGKPDRDSTQALEAEADLQTMILRYPHSKWTPEAVQRLRDVQEVLAEGKYDIAQFYYIRRDYPAAAARLLDLTRRYPLFSGADKANWMLGEIYQKFEKNNFAARFYENIVREYPLSPLVPAAKKKLIAMGYPVPRPDPKALALMEKQETYEKKHRQGIMDAALGDALNTLKSGPSLARAARYGEPNLTPETDIVSAGHGGRQLLMPSVVAMAANSAATEIDGKVPMATVSASASPSGGVSGSVGGVVTAMSSERPTSQAGDTGADNSVSAATVGQGQAQTMKDPVKGPKPKSTKVLKPEKVAKPKGKSAKNGPPPDGSKKKKGLLHKIIPW